MTSFFWTQVQDIGPLARVAHAMAFTSEKSVLFGGRTEALSLADTWQWDGARWTQVADTGPSARFGHCLSVAPDPEQFLLFGGEERPESLAGDTWEWNGQDWTQVEDTGPQPRRGHAMALDEGRDRVVLHGGFTAIDEVSGETWTWDGDRWTQAENVGPGPRANHVMAYDSQRDVVVLFGGSHPDGSFYGDTWTWDGERWRQVQDIGPMGTAHAAFTFVESVAVLFGGLSGEAQAPSGTTWSWDGEFWTQQQDIGPRPRWGHAMAYDGEGDIVLFGGVADRADNVTAETLCGDTWTLPAKAAPGQPSPEPRPDPEIEGMTVSPEVVPRGGNVTLTVRLRRALEQPTLVTITVAGQFFADISFPPMVPLMQRQVGVNLPFGEYELEARVRPEDEPVTARMLVTI